MGAERFSNRASSTLAAGISNAATSLSVQAGDGAKFPALAAGQSFRAVIQDGDLDSSNREIILVTARTSDAFTITRAQEGSAALTWATGATVAHVGTAATFTGMVQKSGDDLTGPLNFAPTVSVAAASTVNLAAQLSNVVTVTGNTTITALGTLAAGAIRYLRFTGTPQLTHNATSLILPGAANIAAAAGDAAAFESLGSGNWRCIGYLRANGKPVVLPSATDVGLGNVTNESKATMFTSPTFTGQTNFASQLDFSALEAGGFRIYRFSGDWYWRWNIATGLLGWVGNGGERVTIDGSGNINSVGTITGNVLQSATSITASQNIAATGFVNAGAAYGFTTNGTVADGSNWVCHLLNCNPSFENVSLQGYHVPGSWAGMRMVFGTTTPAVIEFRSSNSGQIYAGGVLLTSDGRLKIKRQTIRDALDKVDQLRGITYLRKDIKDPHLKVQRRHMGLIAQDVQRVASEAVDQSSDKRKTLSVNYGALMGLIVNAIKELHGKVRKLVKLNDDVRELRAELRAVKARLKKLEAA